MAEAEPTSAWQPPSAPEIEALFAMTSPKAPAAKRKSSCSSWLRSNFWIAAVRTAGRQPALPAVGVAQTKPIFALCSLTAMAFRAADRMVKSDKALPLLRWRSSLAASPPVKPLRDLFSLRPSSTEAFMTSRLRSMRRRTSARSRPVS